MTTTADVIANTRSLLHSREQMSLLNADITAVATTLVLTHAANGAQAGAVLGIDLEEMHVFAASGTTMSTVKRGINGSTAATHTAGAIVYVNPEYTDWDIFRAVNHVLDDLSAQGLFKVAPVEFTYRPGVQGYNLTSVTAIEDVLEVLADQPDSSQLWVPIPRSAWELKRNANTTDFASGFALVLRGGALSPGRAVRVLYRQPFSSLTSLSDNVETISGLHAQAHDLLSLGAAVRLRSGLAARAASTASQGDTRRASEVSISDALRATAGLRQDYEDRLNAELARLERRWPVMLW